MKERPYFGRLWIPPFETFSRLWKDLRKKPFKTYRKRQVPRFLKIKCPETRVPLTFAISYNPHGRFYNMTMTFAPFGEHRTIKTSFPEDQVSDAFVYLKGMIRGNWINNYFNELVTLNRLTKREEVKE